MSDLVKKEEKKEEKGASMVEYALLVALIAVIAIAGVRILGGAVSESFSETSSALAG